MGLLKVIIFTLASLLLLQLISFGFSLYRRYLDAQKIGLPVIWTPVNQGNTIWLLIQKRMVPLIRRLPFGLGNWVEMSRNAWLFRCQWHEKLGSAFVLVTPTSTQVILANPKAADEVFLRSKVFIKSERSYLGFDTFGKNVLTTNGESWQRHRRITTPPFNERNSDLVWKTSLSQASGMINSWVQQKQAGILSTWHDTMSLALNVLLEAGFGKSHSFESEDQSSDEGDKGGYKHTQRVILDNLLITALTFHYPFLPLFLFPSRWSKVKQASVDFRHQLKGMVEEERISIQEKGVESDSLMSALLRSSESMESSGAGRNSLSEDEITGNLFIYTLAGHDTTANTLAYAVTLLSINPDLQQWLREEINSILDLQESPQKWQYEMAYPQLKRCLAVMYETLRLYPPVPNVPRATASAPMPLIIDGKEYIIPPNTTVGINVTTIQVDPEHWGPDPLTFRPQRWITSSSTANISQPDSTNLTTLQQTLSREQHITPAAGTYMPWTAGPRICPGKKFSQVEFVAVVAFLFRKYRVSPLQKKGETKEAATERLKIELEDSGTKITLKMRERDKVGLKWVEI